MTNEFSKTTFKELPFRSDLLEASLIQAKKFSDFDTLALIGIGGSAVGPETLWKILKQPGSSKKLVFFDNTDFVDAQKKMQTLDLARTAWFIVSKSGSTLETLATTEWVAEIYRNKAVSFYDKCCVCTEKVVNPLSSWAQSHQIEILEIPVGVGGRFSVLAPVGLYPLAFGGVPVQELLNGARKALEEQAKIRQQAERCFASFKQHPITVFWFYSSVAKPLGAWIQQLWAESLAKKLDLKGERALDASTPFFAVGASDQHSILQQVSDGKKDKFVIFFRSRELENFSQPCQISEFPSLFYLQNQPYGRLIKAAAEGTRQALENEGVKTDEVFYDDHSATSFGYLVMWFELLVADIGYLMGLNPFDQPGVELSKKNTKEILEKSALRS